VPKTSSNFAIGAAPSGEGKRLGDINLKQWKWSLYAWGTWRQYGFRQARKGVVEALMVHGAWRQAWGLPGSDDATKFLDGTWCLAVWDARQAV